MRSRFISYRELLLEVYLQYQASVSGYRSLQDIFCTFIKYISCTVWLLVFCCYGCLCVCCSAAFYAGCCSFLICTIFLIVVFHCVGGVFVCRPLCHIVCVSGHGSCHTWCPACKGIACISTRCSFKCRGLCSVIQVLCLLIFEGSLGSRLIGYRELKLEVYLQHKASVSGYRSAQDIRSIGCVKYISGFLRCLISICYISTCICGSTAFPFQSCG